MNFNTKLFTSMAILLSLLFSTVELNDNSCATPYSFIANKQEIIHGHTLPPEPDAVVNNSTLLGVDSNDNGVRDDVERWIYHTYKDKHPIHVDIAMQGAREYKKILETPKRGKEIRKEVNAHIYCEGYYLHCTDNIDKNKLSLIDEDIITKFFVNKIYFNTQERMSTLTQYNNLLSGGVYPMIWCDKRKSYCDFNTSKYEERYSTSFNFAL